MPPEPVPHPDEDIRQALDRAGAEPSSASGPAANPVSDTVALEERHPLLVLRYGWAKCGLTVEKYPWQSIAAFVGVMGCCMVCMYFGLTVLAALIFFVVNTDDI